MRNAIVDAARDGDIPGVLRAIAVHPNLINTLDESGDTPLTAAIKNKHLEAAARLLGRGADINARDVNQDTPLFIAIRQTDYPLTKFLIDRNADYRLLDANKVSALDRALTYGFASGAQLIAERADDDDTRRTNLLRLLDERAEKTAELLAVSETLRQLPLLHSSSGRLDRNKVLSTTVANSTATPHQAAQIRGYSDLISALTEASTEHVLVHTFLSQSGDKFYLYTDDMMSALLGAIIIPQDLI